MYAGYALESHYDELVRIDGSGAWPAQQMIGKEVSLLAASDQENANRLFDRNLALYQSLRAGYSACATV